MTPAGLLLAAGAGRRMGRPKALLRDRHGVPFLDRAVGLLFDGRLRRRSRWCSGHPPTRPAGLLDAAGWSADPAVDVVVADDWDEGMGASLRAGLRASGRGLRRRGRAGVAGRPSRRRRRRAAPGARGRRPRRAAGAGASDVRRSAGASGADRPGPLGRRAGDGARGPGSAGRTCAATGPGPASAATWPPDATWTAPRTSRRASGGPSRGSS